ncbi:hypothetical protein B0T14DRAFT_531805 [Immersiella caudata]|uniref:Uncharacterized protein n=1 Tax=Immersiella caudata TaxID=314043 RepID=A0AA39U4F8_9PEZI|nr:hypothetical protein B0T14DRAFT_531805 [Immersiella caudata]
MLSTRRRCGVINGCDDTNCNSLNNPNTGLGGCRGGPWDKCPCAAVCDNKTGSCRLNNCQGKNNVCQNGPFVGVSVWIRRQGLPGGFIGPVQCKGWGWRNSR